MTALRAALAVPDLTGPGERLVSVKPITLDAPGRGDDLQVRVSAPEVGDHLPVIVFSHGNAWSLDGYAPLADFWAAHGFVVIQPTHLDSRTLGITPEDPRFADIWRIRIDDLSRCLDNLDLLEEAVPGLQGRVNTERVAVAGHSWGATTASALLGARVLSPDGRPGQSWADPRVTAGVLLAVAGLGGEFLTPFAAEHLPFLHPTFTDMSTDALVVAGDHDQSMLSVRGPAWWTDAYTHSPAPKSLLTLVGAEHSFGGIVGQEVKETTDDSPERVALIQQVTTAYLRHALGVDDVGWAAAQELLVHGHAAGRLESKR